jgi:hypothetical protein
VTVARALEEIPRLLSFERVAETLDVCARTVRRLVDTGELGEVYYVSGRQRIAERAVTEYLCRNRKHVAVGTSGARTSTSASRAGTGTPTSRGARTARHSARGIARKQTASSAGSSPKDPAPPPRPTQWEDV